MKNLVNIKVSKEIADLLCIYCKLNNAVMSEFVSEIFENKFRGFKEQVKALNDFKVE